MTTELHVRKLLPAKAALVTYAATYVRKNGTTFQHANPHLLLLCPDDEPGYQCELRSTSSRKFGPKMSLTPGQVVRYRKPGHRKYRAVKKSLRFGFPVVLEAALTFTFRSEPNRYAEDGEDRWLEGTFTKSNFGFTLGVESNRSSYNFIREVTPPQTNQVWIIERASVDNRQGILTLEIALPNGANFDDAYRTQIRCDLMDWNNVLGRPHHVTRAGTRQGKLHLFLNGKPGEWLITDTKTGEYSIGHGDTVPHGYVAW